MMFDLRRPCSNCPFRIGQGHLFRMAQDRLGEIFRGTAFQCHKTLIYDDDGRAVVNGPKTQQCAGLMAVLHRSGEPRGAAPSSRQAMVVSSRSYLSARPTSPAASARASRNTTRPQGTMGSSWSI